MIAKKNKSALLITLTVSIGIAALLFHNNTYGQYSCVSIFTEGNDQALNPSKIGLNFNLKDVDQLIVNYNKQWIDLPIGPKNLTISYNKTINNLGFAASIKSLDFGGAFHNIQCVLGGRYKLKITEGHKVIFGISALVGQFQGNFSNTTVINLDDPNIFSFNNQTYLDGNVGITYVGGTNKKFSLALSASKNSVQSILSILSTPVTADNGWETSCQIINNYVDNKSSNGITLYSVKGIMRNTYGIGRIAQIESDFGVHLSQRNSGQTSLQNQNFRIGAYYGLDLTNSQFNTFGVRLSINPQFKGKSAFGGLGYSVLALGKSGTAGNNVGSIVGFQKTIE